MVSGFFSRLGGDGRAERIFNRALSRVARATPWGRSLFERTLGRLPPRPCHVLFVCKGNVCRSAYAEAKARAMAARTQGWTFSSAGLEAKPGTSPPADAIRLAGERGLDLGVHRSRSIAAIDPAAIDVVFVMEPTQVRRGELAPFRARSPILLLGSLAGDPHIPDPYGRDPDTFRQCFATIDSAIDRLLERGSSGALPLTGPHRPADRRPAPEHPLPRTRAKPGGPGCPSP